MQVRRALWLAQGFATAEFDAPLFIDFQHLDHDLLAFLQHIRYTFDALFGDLGDMYQAVCARHDLDKCAEIGDLFTFAAIDFADLSLRRMPRMSSMAARAASHRLTRC